MKKISAAILLALLPSFAVPAFAQTTDNDHDLLPAVEGTYVSKDGLAEFTFPVGWKGAELENGAVTAAIASDGGAGISNTPDYSKPLMMLITSDTKDISDPGTTFVSAASAGLLYCTPSNAQNAWINGAFGISLIASCSAGAANSTLLVMKTLLVETSTNWVMAAYIAPQDDFEQGSIAFGNALRSFKVFNQMEPSPQIPLTSTYYDLRAAGANVTMEVISTSTLKGFSLDEPSRSALIKVDETGNSTGILLVPVGLVLTDPYSVSLDGAAVNATGLILKDESGGEQMIKVTYPAGSHEISITGVQVVPEFPATTLVLVATIAGAATIIARIFRHKMPL